MANPITSPKATGANSPASAAQVVEALLAMKAGRETGLSAYAMVESLKSEAARFSASELSDIRELALDILAAKARANLDRGLGVSYSKQDEALTEVAQRARETLEALKTTPGRPEHMSLQGAEIGPVARAAADPDKNGR